MSIIVPLLVFCVLVFVHELGHFLLAKWNKVGVLEFAIGFGPLIFSRRVGETVYSLRAIPLGGYVKMVGEDPRTAEGIDPKEFEELHPEERKLMADKGRWFIGKGLGARSAIVFAGPLFNILFAILASITSFALYGESVPVERAVIGDVVPGHPADKAGLKSKDLVRSINGVEVGSWKELSETIRNSSGAPLTLSVHRSGDAAEEVTMEFSVTPTQDNSELEYLEGGKVKNSFRIGIMPDLERSPISFPTAVMYGTYHVYIVTRMTAMGIWGMVTGNISAKNIAGPIFIFSEADRSAKRGMEYLFEFMIFLSVGLAVLNLLPVPVLDGGHLFFFLLEAIFRKPVNLKFRERASQVGMFLLLALMIFALSNDIMRHIG